MKGTITGKFPPVKLPPLPEDCPQQIPSWVRVWVGSSLLGGRDNLPGGNFPSAEGYVLPYSVNDL